MFLLLAISAVIVLPLLPSQGYGPWGVLNPFAIWLIVVLVSALSFAGFVAMRLLGERRGLAVTGAVGGMVSSTAVTYAMAERTRADRGLGGPAASAVVLASCVMSLRIAVLAGIIFNFTRNITTLSGVIFVVSPRWRLLTAAMLAEVETGRIGGAASLGTLLIVVVWCVNLLGYLLFERKNLRRLGA